MRSVVIAGRPRHEHAHDRSSTSGSYAQRREARRLRRGSPPSGTRRRSARAGTCQHRGRPSKNGASAPSTSIFRTSTRSSFALSAYESRLTSVDLGWLVRFWSCERGIPWDQTENEFPGSVGVGHRRLVKDRVPKSVQGRRCARDAKQFRMRLERMDLAPLADCGREQKRVLADVGAAVERNHSRLEKRAERFGDVRIRSPADDVDTGRCARSGRARVPTRYGHDEGSTWGEKPVSMPAHAAVDSAHGMFAEALAAKKSQ